LYFGVTIQSSDVTNTEFSAVHVSFIDLKFYVCFINLDIYIKQLKFLEGEHEVFP